MLLRDWVARYIAERDLTPRTAEFYRCCVGPFERWAGASLDLDTAARRLNEYLAFRVTGNRITARSTRAALTVLLRAAEREGLVNLGKVRPVRLPEHRPRGLSREEIAALLMHSSAHQRAAILLAYDTALRRADLFSATWSEMHGDRLIHTAQKTRRLVVRRVRSVTLDALRAIRAEGDDRLLPIGLGPTGWRKRWVRLGQQAGVDVRRRGLQAIRRTAATQAHRAGQDASALLGHSTPGLAARWYLDPSQLDDSPPLPPALVP